MRKTVLIAVLLCAALAATAFLLIPRSGGSGLSRPVKTYVSVVDGNAKLFVDGKPVDLLGFYATSEVIEYIDKAARYGVTFCRVEVRWPVLDIVTKEFASKNRRLMTRVKELIREGRLREAVELLPDFEVPEDASELLDFSDLDKIMDYAARKGVYIILSFHYLSPPIWWVKNFPDQLQTNNTGGLCYMATFNSPALLKYGDQVVRAVVNRYKDHPALLGWGLDFGWTNEDNYPGANYYNSWGMYDYSPTAIKRFREWLREKYGSVEALREAWGNGTVTFENAVPPQPLPPPEGYRETVEFVNGPGDTRREWMDWMEFRLEEKTECMLHFARLIKELDPNHVLVQTPATPLLLGVSGAVFLAIDYYSYVESPVDVVYVNPGLKEDTARAIKLYGYPPFLKYFEQRGKAAFIKWEGRPGVDYDAHPELITTVAEMARKTGTGLAIWGGHVPMPGTGEEQPEFTDQQIELFIETFKALPEGGLNKSRIAILEDPRLCFFTYYGSRPYKLVEAAALWGIIHLAGLDADVIPVDEVRENPDAIYQYDALILDNLYRMDDWLVDMLVKYVEKGGGLFIVGRTGAYDWYGERKYHQLKRLLGISSNITEYKAAGYSWTFTDADDPLLEGIRGERADGPSQLNILYIPVFDYEAEGYTVLATLDQNNTVAVAGRKGRIVFWFPRLGLLIADREPEQLAPVLTFLRNLYELYQG